MINNKVTRREDGSYVSQDGRFEFLPVWGVTGTGTPYVECWILLDVATGQDSFFSKLKDAKAATATVRR